MKSAHLHRRLAQRRRTEGLHYDAGFLSDANRAELVRWLATLRPLWELRYSELRPLPDGEQQRRLLRPVYWLGNWQFACLDYYRPPHGVTGRCVAAEPFPPLLQKLVTQMEERAWRMFRDDADTPAKWRLNTCLINFYGKQLQGEKWVDVARVGEHKDFEPGPVASLSLGERALFQFVRSRRPQDRDEVVAQQWLEDGSLQVFGGDKWKHKTFHRVQRVDVKDGHRFDIAVPGFETRRINFTFRYVPQEHVTPFSLLPDEAKRDVRSYMETLAQSATFFAKALTAP